LTSVQSTNSYIPTDYVLEQNHPNPFNPSMTINFSIPEASFVSPKVYNSLGQKIETLVSKELNAGDYKYDWGQKTFQAEYIFTSCKQTILLRQKRWFC